MSARSLIKPEEPDPAKAMLCLPLPQTYAIHTSLAVAISLLMNLVVYQLSFAG